MPESAAATQAAQRQAVLRAAPAMLTSADPPSATARQQAPAVARAMSRPAVHQTAAPPARAAKAVNAKTTPRRAAAVLRAPVPNMCARKVRPPRAHPHPAQAEATQAVAATTEVARQAIGAVRQAAVTTEAVRLREVPHRVQAAVREAVIAAEAVAQVRPAATVQAAEVAVQVAAADAVRAAEEDKFQPNSRI